MQHLKQRMCSRFDIKFFEKLKSFIGWKVTRKEDGIKVDQCGYVRQVLEDHGTDEDNGFLTPQPKSADTSSVEEDVVFLD